MSRHRLLILISCVSAAGVVLVSLAVAPAGEGPRRWPPTRPGAASRPERRGPRADRRRPLSEAEKEQLLAFAKQYAPELHQRLLRMMEEDPSGAQMLLRMLQRTWHRAWALPPEARGAFMERQRLNVEIFRLVGQYRHAEDPEQKRTLKTQLRERVAQRFDSDLTVKAHQVRRLEEQLAALKRQLERRRQERETVIDRTVEKLLESRPGPGPGRHGRRSAPTP